MVIKVDLTDVAHVLLVTVVELPHFFHRGQLPDLKFFPKIKEAG